MFPSYQKWLIKQHCVQDCTKPIIQIIQCYFIVYISDKISFRCYQKIIHFNFSPAKTVETRSSLALSVFRVQNVCYSVCVFCFVLPLTAAGVCCEVLINIPPPPLYLVVPLCLKTYDKLLLSSTNAASLIHKDTKCNKMLKNCWRT